MDIEDANNNKTYEFPCNRWLAKDEDDGSLLRELPCANREKHQSTASKSMTGKFACRGCFYCSIVLYRL